MIDDDDDFESEPTPRPARRSRAQSGEDRRIATDEKRAHRQAYSPSRVPAVMTSDDRALAGLAQRRAAVVEELADDSTTDPLVLAQRQAANPRDPSDLIKAAFSIAKEQMRKERESAERAQMGKLEELLNRAPKDTADTLVARLRAVEILLNGDGTKDNPGIAKVLESATEYIGNQRKSIARIRNALIASVALIAGFIYHRGTGDENARLRLEANEASIAEIKRWLDPQPSHGRRFVWPPIPQTKGQDP